MSKQIIIKNTVQIENIRKSCKLAAQTLNYISEFVKEGVTTEYLDQLIENYIREHGATPAPLNYKQFPKSSCISLNEVVCHGIPSKYTLKQGDILNIDVTTNLNGYFGDTSRMFTIGKVSEQAEKLIDTTKKCLEIGIKECFPGNRFGNIGYKINEYASSKGYKVVTDFCGHGVGLKFHEEPQVEHIAEKNSGKLMLPGMIFTIEPMINEGTARTKVDSKDGWTARTADNKLSAQFEHSILITENGHEVLTLTDS